MQQAPVFTDGVANIVDVDNNFVNRSRMDRKQPVHVKRGTMPLRTSATMVRRGKAAVRLGILDERLGYFVRRLQLWVFQDFIKGLSALDLSPAQFSVLAIIAANTGLSQAELSATLGIERARLVRLLHDLGRRNLTQRLPSSRDKRSHALRLTADGQKAMARAKALSVRHEERLMKKLGPERYRAIFDAVRGV